MSNRFHDLNNQYHDLIKQSHNISSWRYATYLYLAPALRSGNDLERHTLIHSAWNALMVTAQHPDITTKQFDLMNSMLYKRIIAILPLPQLLTVQTTVITLAMMSAIHIAKKLSATNSTNARNISQVYINHVTDHDHYQQQVNMVTRVLSTLNHPYRDDIVNHVTDHDHYQQQVNTALNHPYRDDIINRLITLDAPIAPSTKLTDIKL